MIGGSGLYIFPDLTDVEEGDLETPWGEPSDTYMVGTLRGRRIAFLARHGRLLELLRDHLLHQVMQQFLLDGALNQYASSVAARADDPYTVVDRILEKAGCRETISAATGREPENLFVLDHLGVAVSSLADAVKFYQQILGLQVSGYETIEQEKTNVAMIPVSKSRIELLEPTEPDSPIGRFLAKRGEGLHHICLRVPDLRATIARLQQLGVQLINPEPAIGAGGHQYVFVHPSSAGGVLVELVEAQPSAI